MPISIDKIRKLVTADLHQLDTVISNKLESQVALINTVCSYIMQNKGKQIRPIMLFLVAKAIGYENKNASHVNMAAVIELIHTATLLHDDVVDESSLRRGVNTANANWGNPASILVGDFIYSRAFQMMVEPNNIAIIRLLSDTTNMIAEGEVLQLLHTNNAELTETEYLQIIRSKTATLFKAAAVIPAILNQTDSKTIDALATMATNLGVAFQITDDMLDYSSVSQVIGKNIGDDLKDGKNTLPLIIALQKTSASNKKIIQNAIQHADLTKVEKIIDIIHTSDALSDCKLVVAKNVEQALEAIKLLPNNNYSQALGNLAKYIQNRIA